MPPTTPPAPPAPTGEGSDARQYLESRGLVSMRPPIRASAIGWAITDEFRFYLSEILGIKPLFQWSRALSTGTWFHKRAELLFRVPPETGALSPEAELLLGRALDERLREHEDIARHLGMSRAKLDLILESEQRDFAMGNATYLTCIHRLRPRSLNGKTVAEIFNSPENLFISAEQIYQVTPRSMRVPLVCQPDLIYLERSTNTLWLVDWKTCQESPTSRLQTCTIENQTFHYLYVISSLLETGSNLFPAGARLGGIHHVACRKPSIELSGADRDFTLEEKVLRSGPRKGQTVTERIYHGEPRMENYLERCRRWAEGTEEYMELAPSREGDPCVNISTVYFDRISDEAWTRYHQRLSRTHSLIVQEHNPGGYVDNPGSLRQMGGTLSEYLPFYTEPVSRWPEIVASGPFLIAHRDESLMEVPENA